MRIRRIISTVIVLVLLGGLARLLWKAGAFAPEREPVRPIPTAKVELKDIEEDVLATGEVSPVDQTEIRSEVSGQVTQLQVKPGERVEKDKQLLQLDRRELESQAKELQFQIAADELRAKQAKMELDRDNELISQGFIPQKEYDDANIALMLAQNDLEVQRAKLETLRQQIIKTDIRSPHAGIVLKLDAREGEVIIGASSVSSGTVLMRIADLSRLKVDTRLNEVDVVKVNVGDKVQLTFDAVPNRTIAGTVTYISPSADTGESSNQNGGGGGQRGSSGGGGSVRGFETIVALDEIDSRIRPGITAHVKISMSKVSKAVAAPLTAVFMDGKRSVAYVKKGEQFERREIEPGISDSTVVEIKKGLAAGDEIATEKPADDKLAPTTAPATGPTTSATTTTAVN